MAHTFLSDQGCQDKYQLHSEAASLTSAQKKNRKRRAQKRMQKSEGQATQEQRRHLDVIERDYLHSLTATKACSPATVKGIGTRMVRGLVVGAPKPLTVGGVYNEMFIGNSLKGFKFITALTVGLLSYKEESMEG